MTKPRKITANYVETEIDDEILLVDLDGGELFSLSGTGREVWKMIDGERSAEAIAEALGREFSAPIETIERDVSALIRDLEQSGLVKLY